jgi:amidase
MSALDLPLREQAAGIAAGEIDAGELLDACLARIEERNPDLNAVVATFPGESRAMHDAAPDGPLWGVPVLVKDEWPLPWRAETVGAAAVPGVELRPGESGPYRALRDAGAVIAGVGNMHELGSSSTGNTSLYGAAHNPWDLERSPAGSSPAPSARTGSGRSATRPPTAVSPA